MLLYTKNFMKTPKKTKKTVKKTELIVDEPKDIQWQEPVPVEKLPRKKSFPFTIVSGALLLGILLGLVVAYGGMPVMALVNGQPIFRWEAAQVLFQRYGSQTVEGMITEKLIAGEAQKANVTVSQTDITTKEQEILKNFGSNMSIDDFLKLQGLQRKDFDNQIKLQLTVQKLLGKDITISNQDIDSYIASNSGSLTATEPAKLREEAKSALFDEQISAKIQTWLQEIKAKAKIQRLF